MSLRSLVLAAAFLVTATAAAADWPQWRGPARTGLSAETGLLQAWPADGPKVAWTAKNLGIGFGTPIVVEGKIYGIGSRNGKDGVWALNEADGKEVWFTEFTTTAKLGAPQNNGPSSSPTYAKGKLYTVSIGGTLVCMDAATGKEVWKAEYVKDFGGKVPTWGYCDSVLVDGDKVICAPGGDGAAVAALKADTGEALWKTTDAGKSGGGGGYSSPVKATFGGTPMYVVLLGQSAGLVGVHADTGKTLWQYKNKPAAGGVAQIPTPIVKGDKVWVSCSYGGGAALLQVAGAGDKFEVKELKAYAKPDLNNHHGGMVLVGDYVYFGHDQNQGYPVCVEFATGEIKWGPVKKATEGGSGSVAVTYADGRLYYRYQNGVMVLIEPSPESLKVVSAFKLPPPDVKQFAQSWPHPVVANGKMLIRDQTVMYAYDIKAK